jgi:asparagine synthetase B (glutamine-hydrolysing)
MTSTVRELLEKVLTDAPQNPAIALSGGVDSVSVLFALLELKKEPQAYTFHIAGHESTDLRAARAVCDRFDVPFTPVELPTDIQTIKEDTYSIINGLGLTAKTDIECIWPRWYLLDAVSESTLITGDCADAHFANSKRGAIHYRDSVEKMNQYRDEHFGDPNYAQLRTIRKIGKALGVNTVRAPYRDEAFRELFYDQPWDAVNTPRMKEPILEAYPGRFRSVPTHSANLQTSDSKIQDQFEKLVNSTWNINDWKSPVGIYNAISRNEVPP